MNKPGKWLEKGPHVLHLALRVSRLRHTDITEELDLTLHRFKQIFYGLDLPTRAELRALRDLLQPYLDESYFKVWDADLDDLETQEDLPVDCFEFMKTG